MVAESVDGNSRPSAAFSRQRRALQITRREQSNSTSGLENYRAIHCLIVHDNAPTTAQP
jgi:hypothetical protein